MGAFTCENCPDRYPGCHGDCKKYKREKDEYHKAKKWVNKDKEFDAYLIESNKKNGRKKRKMYWKF